MPQLEVKHLGVQAYEEVWQQMLNFTNQRTETTPDELWLVNHPSVYTLGLAGKPEHLLTATDIPVVKTDRGGQITWHGPGQLVAYPLLNLKRNNLGVRQLVTLLEKSVIDYLASLGISAYADPNAPGVYLSEGDLVSPQLAGAKIAALGLKIRKGCSYHGLSFNFTCSLEAFNQINPCGYAGLKVARLADLTPSLSYEQMQQGYLNQLLASLSLANSS